MSGEIHEECGVFGIFSPLSSEVAHTVYSGLYALQHRGQEGCGIAVCDGNEITLYKDVGQVNEVFDGDILEKLGNGNIAIGHVRYGTTGGAGRDNTQPMLTEHPSCTMALVHNGNLVNARELRHVLERDGVIFRTTSDTEMISHIITRCVMKKNDLYDALADVSEIIEGAYSLILMFPDKMVVMRDKNGFRPLCIGTKKDGSFIAASESCALDAVDAEFLRDVRPGEIIIIDQSGMKCDERLCSDKNLSPCIFEYIYFARPDSVIDGCSVHDARLRAGEFLADDCPADADIVIGVPDSGLDAAIGFSRRSGIPYGLGFIKNKYIGRTFISPGQNVRERQVRIKLNPISEAVKSKRVVMVDDSIVRGTTSARIVKLLREAGATEVHVRITSPPFLYPCFYGTDVDSNENLVAAHHNINEICEIIGADSLGYLKTSHLSDLIEPGGGRTVCAACFDGKYSTHVPCENNFY